MSLFAYIKSRVSIYQVVGEYTQLKKAGGYFKSRCPFHHEKTASFTVSPDKEIFYCFGCHVHGDVISFISKIENCSPLQAAQSLAERYNIDIKDHVDVSPERPEKKHNYLTLCRAVADWCHGNLLKSTTVLDYLKGRGITQHSIDRFNIGYFPGGLPAIKTFMDAMQKESILVTELEEAHIIARGKTVWYSPFEERVMFPIKNHLGHCSGFGGRIYKPNDTRPKYYNSHENDYFIKGSLLFGLDIAKKDIKEKGFVILVEGYTDCIALAQNGYPNTVATLGTACTINHLKELARYTQRMVVMYDNDQAGQQAILRLAHLSWQVYIDLEVVTLPSGYDPALFCSQGLDLEAYLAQTKDIFVFFIELIGKDFLTKTLQEKVQLTRGLLEVISYLDDPLKQDILLQRASGTFNLPFESLKRECQRLFALRAEKEEKSMIKAPPQQSAHEEIVNNNASRLEKKIFCAIMNNIQLFNLQNEIDIIPYMPSPFRDLLKKLAALKEKEPAVDFDRFSEHLDDHERQLVQQFLLTNEGGQVSIQEFDSYMVQLYKKQWKIVAHNFKLRLMRARYENNQAQVQELLQDFMTLKKKLMIEIAQIHTQEGN